MLQKLRNLLLALAILLLKVILKAQTADDRLMFLADMTLGETEKRDHYRVLMSESSVNIKKYNWNGKRLISVRYPTDDGRTSKDKVLTVEVQRIGGKIWKRRHQ